MFGLLKKNPTVYIILLLVIISDESLNSEDA